MISRRLLSGLGIAAAILFWVAGFFSFTSVLLVSVIVVIGTIVAAGLSFSSKTVGIVVGLIIMLVLGTDVMRSQFFVDGQHFEEAISRAKSESDMEWAENVDPHALKSRELLARRCRQADDAAARELHDRLKTVSDSAFSLDIAQLERERAEITRLQEFRVKCREAIMQEEAPSSGSSIADRSDSMSVWSVVPAFTSESGLILLLSIIFLVVGWLVSMIHRSFGGWIMTASVVMVLAGAGNWLSSQNSLFAQLRDGIMGGYNQPWYVTVLALSAVGVLLTALFGVETKIKFRTVAVACVLLGLAWIARPGAMLSDISSKLEMKLGDGIDVKLPPAISTLFGGNAYVPCKDHAETFSVIGVGGGATCWQDLNPGESFFINFYGNPWMLGGDRMSGVRVRLERDAGTVVYEGPYRDGTLPPSSAALVTNGPSAQRILVKVNSPR